MSHIERLPNEVLHDILSRLDGKTLLVCIPQVCRRWRAVCQGIQGVHLVFSWWRGGVGTVPVEVLAGWKQTPFMLGAGSGGGSISSSMVNARCWKTGLCELFPRTTSVTMSGGNNVEDAHMMALADKCPGITHADFGQCENLTDAAVVALLWSVREPDGCSSGCVGRQVPWNHVRQL